MIEYDNLSLAELGNERKESFEILYNKNRVSSWEGIMYITSDKIYYIVNPNGGTYVNMRSMPEQNSWNVVLQVPVPQLELLYLDYV